MKIIFIILFYSSILISQNLSGYDIIKKMTNKDKPKDIKSILRMESIKADGSKRTSIFKSWVKDDGGKQLIWFIEPIEYKGISFLKIEKDTVFRYPDLFMKKVNFPAQIEDRPFFHFFRYFRDAKS